MKFYHLLLLFFLYIASVVIGIVMSSVFYPDEMSANAYLLLGLVIMITIIALFRFIRGRCRTCPQCRKGNAMEDISREIISSTDTTMRVDQPIKDKNNGKITGWYTQTVPATRYIIDYHRKCRYCGYEDTVRREETYAK